MSAWEIGRGVSWAEACDLVDQALVDTSTELFASVAGWRYPASMPLLLLVASSVGKAEVMPWHNPQQSVDPVEVEAANSELLEEIIFSKS